MCPLIKTEKEAIIALCPPAYSEKSVSLINDDSLIGHKKSFSILKFPMEK